MPIQLILITTGGDHPLFFHKMIFNLEQALSMEIRYIRNSHWLFLSLSLIDVGITSRSLKKTKETTETAGLSKDLQHNSRLTALSVSVQLNVVIRGRQLTY